MNPEQAQFEIEALQRRLAEYAGELERVKAQCAAMRSALEKARTSLHCESDEIWREAVAAVQAALALDAGKGYVPAEEVEKCKTCLCLIGERLSKTGRIAEFLNQAHAPAHICEAWKDLVYASGIRAQMQAGCDPGGFVPADKARVIAEALQSSQSELLFSPRPIIKDEQQRQFIVNKSQVAIAMARELGLLKDE